MNTLRVWLIHRLGGVEKPKPVCLRRTFGPMTYTTSGSGSGATTIMSNMLTAYCDCPDCKQQAAA